MSPQSWYNTPCPEREGGLLELHHITDLARSAHTSALLDAEEEGLLQGVSGGVRCVRIERPSYIRRQDSEAAGPLIVAIGAPPFQDDLEHPRPSRDFARHRLMEVTLRRWEKEDEATPESIAEILESRSGTTHTIQMLAGQARSPWNSPIGYPLHRCPQQAGRSRSNAVSPRHDTRHPGAIGHERTSSQQRQREAYRDRRDAARDKTIKYLLNPHP